MSLQIGPDNKIYSIYLNHPNSGPTNFYLGVIHAPNRRGFACNFSPQQYSLPYNDTLFAGWYFPNLYFPVRKLDLEPLTDAQGCTGDSLGFANHSDSAFASFTWFFGDGDSLTTTHPDTVYHGYAQSGTYFVRLRAQNPSCNGYVWASDSVEVRLRPYSGFALDTAYYSCQQHHLQITDTSRRANNRLYRWGDGATVSVTDSPLVLTHTYTRSDTFLLQQVTSAHGCTDTFSLPVPVYLEAPPQAGLVVSDSALCAPDSVLLVQQSVYDSLHPGWSQLEIYRNQSLLDSFTTAPDSIYYPLDSPGTYSFHLLAYNGQGCVDTLRLDSVLQVLPRPGLTLHAVLDTLCQALELTLETSARPEAVVQVFSPQLSFQPTGHGHYVDTITRSGHYLSLVTATNGTCTDTVLHGQAMQVGPLARAGVVTDSVVCVLTVLQWQAQDSGRVLGAQTQLSTPGGGTLDLEQEPQPLLQEAGAYVLVRAVSAPHGCTYTDTTFIEARATPVAELLLTEQVDSCGQFYYHYGTTTSASNLTWSFPDGVVDSFTADSGRVRYLSAGTYPVQLVAEEQGCADTATATLQVKGDTVPEPVAVLPDQPLCLSEAVRFISQSGHSESVTWHFGDGATLVAGPRDTVYHQYTQAGQYTIQLEVTNHQGCTRSETWTDTIEVRGLVEADFSLDLPHACTPVSIQLQPQGSDGPGITHLLDWGSGSFAAVNASPPWQHEYPEDGQYQVRYRVSNGACADTALQELALQSFHSSEPVMAKGVTVTEDQTLYLEWEELPEAEQYVLWRAQDEQALQPWDTVQAEQYEDERVEVGSWFYRYAIYGIDACRAVSGGAHLRSILLEGAVHELTSRLWWSPYGNNTGSIIGYGIERDGAEWRPLTSTLTDSASDTGFVRPGQLESCYRVWAWDEAQEWRSESNVLCLPYPSLLWVPSAFSPNGNGLNERFRVEGIGLQEVELRVYSRWGELLWQGEGKQGWDGQLEGQLQPEGVYPYQVRAKAGDGEVIYESGGIHLVR